MSPHENVVRINRIAFVDVTNQTVAEKTYSYEEAVALSKGEHIVCSDGEDKT